MAGNCFLSYFKACSNIGGVPILADDTVASLNYPQPVWPPKWTAAALSSPDHVKHDALEIAEANSLVSSGIDRSEPTIVLNQWLDAAPPRETVRQFLQDLRVVDSIGNEVQRFWDGHVGRASAIAIHIRHGNGENLGSRSAYWLGPLALMRQLAINTGADLHKAGISGKFSDNMPPSLIGAPDQASYERRFCRAVARAFYSLATPDAVPVLFCDAAHIVDLMREVLPTVVVKRKRQLKTGEGPLHQIRAPSVHHDAKGLRSSTISDDIIFDMFVELEVMRRCSGLIFMDSGFSLLARSSLDESHLVRLRPGFINRLVLKVMDKPSLLRGSIVACFHE